MRRIDVVNKTQGDNIGVERAGSQNTNNPARSDREKIFMVKGLEQRCYGWCQTGFV